MTKLNQTRCNGHTTLQQSNYRQCIYYTSKVHVLCKTPEVHVWNLSGKLRNVRTLRVWQNVSKRAIVCHIGIVWWSSFLLLWNSPKSNQIWNTLNGLYIEDMIPDDKKSENQKTYNYTPVNRVRDILRIVDKELERNENFFWRTCDQ